MVSQQYLNELENKNYILCVGVKKPEKIIL